MPLTRGDINTIRGSGRIATQGIASTVRSLTQAGTDAEDLKDLMKELGDLVVKASYGEVPVRTGALKGTIRAGRAKNKARVLVGNARVKYAGPIHWGWEARNIRKQPFLWNALEESRPEILRRFEQAMKDLAKQNHLQP